MSNHTHAVPIMEALVGEATEDKTAIMAKEVAEEVTTGFKGDENIPVSLFQQRFGRPFASEVFGIKNDFFLKLDSDMAAKLNNIDRFVIDYINHNELKDTKTQFRKILQSVRMFMNISDDTKVEVQISRINDAILLQRFLI